LSGKLRKGGSGRQNKQSGGQKGAATELCHESFPLQFRPAAVAAQEWWLPFRNLARSLAQILFSSSS